MLGVSRLAEGLSAFQEGLCSMELYEIGKYYYYYCYCYCYSTPT